LANHPAGTRSVAGVLDRIERASPARLRRLLTWIVVIVMTGLVTHGNYAGSGDAVHYMVIARSIAFDRDLDLGNDYGDSTNIIREQPGAHARPGVNGVLRPVHDVGLPLISSPVFWAAYQVASLTDRLPESLRRRAKLNEFITLRQLLSLIMIGVTAWLGRLFFDVSSAMTGQKALAFLWALVWTLSPPILSHGYVFLTEVPSALIALLVYSRIDEVNGERPIPRGLLLGVLTGLLILVHVRNAGLMLALAALVAWRVRHAPSRGVGFAAGLFVMGAIKIALNLQFWGTAITTPHEHFGAWIGLGSFVSESVSSGLGLLFDARHGLLPSAPVFLLAPAAWWLLARRSRAAGLEVLLLVAAYLVLVLNPVTNIHGWRGGWSPAARFLVPIAPFLGLAVPLLLAARRNLLLAGAIVAAQIALNAFFWGRPMTMWSEGPGPAAFLLSLAGSAFAAAWPIFDTLTGATLLIAAAIVVGWLALTWILVRTASRRATAIA
jgi:hypothetical protein